MSLPAARSSRSRSMVSACSRSFAASASSRIRWSAMVTASPDRERPDFKPYYPGGGSYVGFAYNVGYARAMLQAALAS